MTFPDGLYRKDGRIKNHRIAFPLILDSARKGNAVAQSLADYAYLKGLGVERDQEEAFRWTLKAATQNNDGAMFNLALMFERGDGVSIDD